jgi:hypothetical protein
MIPRKGCIRRLPITPPTKHSVARTTVANQYAKPHRVLVRQCNDEGREGNVTVNDSDWLTCRAPAGIRTLLGFLEGSSVQSR